MHYDGRAIDLYLQVILPSSAATKRQALLAGLTSVMRAPAGGLVGGGELARWANEAARLLGIMDRQV